jgi:hypothetical protein
MILIRSLCHDWTMADGSDSRAEMDTHDVIELYSMLIESGIAVWLDAVGQWTHCLVSRRELTTIWT